MKLFLFLLLSTFASAFETTGVVKSNYDINLAFPIDGIVGKVLVREGVRVQKGQELMRLQDEMAKLEVLRRKLVWEDYSGINNAEKEVGLLKQVYDATKALYERSGSVTKDEMIGVEVRYLSSFGKWQGLLESKKREEIEYRMSEEMLSQHVLRAPVDGIVVAVDIEPGEWARAGEVVLRLVDPAICYVETNILIENRHFLPVGTKVALGNRRGEVVFVSPVADQGSGLVQVRIKFENSDGGIIPGTVVSISVPSAPKK
jgi:RND family efflux transporter MFP subunit